MVQNLNVIIFLKNTISSVQLYSTRSSGHHQSFSIPEFVAENLKANKNQRKRSLILQYSFAQKISLILRISILLKLKIICSQNTAKKLYQFTNFPGNMFLANVCIYLYISLRKFCFKDLARFYLVVWGNGGGKIISLRRLAVWVS